ncbi:hypothetical protein [Acinetobacter sp. TUM15064]|uniref:hypothetical protein n=1 Tax=Acinetobacter sp. TUM15064 TaxID=2609134 RepID=UPI00124D19E5|nr:hypothetical protein [Acinetobacter sp. TUM15064]
MTHFEMLQSPNFKLSLERKIVAHITEEYLKVGMSPPLPKYVNDMATYAEANVSKLANRVRTGAVLFAQLLDEKEKIENA